MRTHLNRNHVRATIYNHMWPHQPNLVRRLLLPPMGRSCIQLCISETKTVLQEPGNETNESLGMRPMKAWEWDQWKPGNEADVNLWSMNLTEVIKSLSSPWRHWIQTNKKQTDKKQFYVFSFRNFAGVDFWHELDALLYFKSTKLLVISLFFSILPPPLFSILLLPSHRWSLPFVCNLTT